jgi:hypothetical protein
MNKQVDELTFDNGILKNDLTAATTLLKET